LAHRGRAGRAGAQVHGLDAEGMSSSVVSLGSKSENGFSAVFEKFRLSLFCFKFTPERKEATNHVIVRDRV
jgi:hypothetical protein